MRFAVFLIVIVCGVYTYFCAVLRYSYTPYAPLTGGGEYSHRGKIYDMRRAKTVPR